jgi:hypothetical protein
LAFGGQVSPKGRYRNADKLRRSGKLHI